MHHRHTAVDGAAQRQAVLHHAEQRGVHQVGEQGGVACSVEGHLHSIDDHAGHTRAGIHHLAGDIHAQLVAAAPVAVVLHDGVAERLQRGAVAQREGAQGDVALGDVVVAVLHVDGRQGTHRHHVAGHHRAAHRGLLLGQIDRVLAEVGMHKHVKVALAGVLALKRRMQRAVERAIEVDEVCPLHAAQHLCQRAGGDRLLLDFLLGDGLPVQTLERVVADTAAEPCVDTS